MTDPYRLLGISPNCSEQEVKEAYKRMAREYNDMRNDTNAEWVKEKMDELNTAYDQVIASKRSGASGANGGGTQYQNYQSSSSYNDIRNLITNGRLADAEQLLNGTPKNARNAEWYFLMGSVLYKKGWLEDAYSHYATACRMDPNNQEYRTAINQMNFQQSRTRGGYNTTNYGPNRSGCSACDICSSLMCADCCCEAMGGDFIRCC